MDKTKRHLQADIKAMKEHGQSWRDSSQSRRREKAESYEDVEVDENIIEIDSEDSRDAIKISNNNKEALLDRQRAYENEQNNRESDRESSSSDIVVVRDDYQSFYEEIEELSKINTLVQLHPDDRVSIKNFKIHKLLGTGAYGKVFSVEKLDGIDKGQVYAMKVLEKYKVTQKKKTTEHTRTEREVLERVIDCPFLATLYYAFQTSEKLYLIMEFVQGGELFSHLYKSENFEENQVRFYIAEIVVALEQLHQQNIIYRDIKLENILLDKDGHIIITDFGLSKELKDGARTNSYCGTIEYMAPEIVNAKNGHDLNVDWWSVGVLIIELLSGQSPFSRENEESNQQIISERIQNSPPNIPQNIGADAKDLILKLLQKDPTKRIGYKHDAAEIKAHRFFHRIDWDILKRKSYDAPMIPEVKDNFDVSQFSEDFTSQLALDLPAENGPPQGPNASRYFRGYSFVAPQFRRRIIAAELQADKPEMNRPALEDVFKMQKDHKRKSPFFSKYRIHQESALIGDGTYSLCMECESRKAKGKFAVKILKLNHDTSQEIDALKKCQGHPNIVQLVETLKDNHFTYIVCELLRGDELFSRIRNNCLDENIVRSYFLQIVDAVTFMHSKSIVHRDLKPENIKFVDNNSSDYDEEEETLKILDFGFAHEETEEETPPCFTLDYAAPESLVKGATKQSRDMWSLGVILYTMLMGNTPFKSQATGREHDNRNFRIQITENIRNGCFNTDNDRWNDISDEAKDLITSLLKVNEHERLSMDEVKKHKWICMGQSERSNGVYETSEQDDAEINRTDSEATINFGDEDDREEEEEEEEVNFTRGPSAEEISKSNDDSSSGIVVSEPNEGSSVGEIEEQQVQLYKNDDSDKEEIETNEPLLNGGAIIQSEEPPTFAKSSSEQLEPENLSLKPADVQKAAIVKDIEERPIEEAQELPFKGFNLLLEDDDRMPFCGFIKEKMTSKESATWLYIKELLCVDQEMSKNTTVLLPTKRRGRRPREEAAVVKAEMLSPTRRSNRIKAVAVVVMPDTPPVSKPRSRSRKKIDDEAPPKAKPQRQKRAPKTKSLPSDDPTNLPSADVPKQRKRNRKDAPPKAPANTSQRKPRAGRLIAKEEPQEHIASSSRKRGQTRKTKQDNSRGNLEDYQSPLLRTRPKTDKELTTKTAKKLSNEKKKTKKDAEKPVRKQRGRATKEVAHADAAPSRKRKRNDKELDETKTVTAKRRKLEPTIRTETPAKRSRVKLEKKTPVIQFVDAPVRPTPPTVQRYFYKPPPVSNHYVDNCNRNSMIISRLSISVKREKIKEENHRSIINISMLAPSSGEGGARRGVVYRTPLQ